MAVGTEEDAARLKTVVERMLVTALGEQVSLGTGQTVPDHSNVYRFSVESRTRQAPTSVIVWTSRGTRCNAPRNGD